MERASEHTQSGFSRRLRGLAGACTLAFLLTSCAMLGRGNVTVVERDVLHIPMRFEVHDPDSERAAEAIESAIRRATALGKRLLANRKTSQFGILNDFDPDGWIVVGPDVLEAAQLALRLKELSEGAYTPTRRPLLNVWGISKGQPRVPSDRQIAFAVARANVKTLELRAEDKSARRLGYRTVIDLEGVAVGAMLDRALEELAARGVPTAMVSTQKLWTAYWEGEQSPFVVEVFGSGEDGEVTPIAQLRLTSRAFAVVYPDEVFVAEDGTRIHEWIDPRSGRPVEGVVTAGVSAHRAKVAAPLAEAAFILGDGTPQMLKRRPGTSWLLSTEAQGQRSSPNLQVRWQDEASGR